MHLKRLLRVPATISFKISIWYASIFILSSLFLFSLAYFYLEVTLTKQDHEEIRLELREVSSLYTLGGISALENFVTESSNSKRKKPLFIRIADNTNKTRHIFSPQLWPNFEIKRLEKIAPANDDSWIRLPATTSEDILEIRSRRVSEGHWIQVGMSSHDREKTLKHFRELFASAMVPLILMGLAGGMFLAFRFLKPIRHIIQTVRSIDIGKMETRVPRTRTGDELDELARLFNDMLDRIHNLIEGMKESLDNVAHDLRTPMTRLRSMAEMALQGDMGADLYREALADALEESDRMLRMLETLMDISEAQTGVLHLDRRMTDISALIAKIIDMYQFVAEEKDIRLHGDTPKELFFKLDTDRMSQALANLMDNALKFTPAGGQIRLEADRNGQSVMIRVQDNGIGISTAELPRIWDRLYRSDRSRHQKGLGLGLSLVKGIVKAHKGRIEVESASNQGATFTIILPSDR